MTRHPLTRFLALVIATVFSATTIALPFADALLDHLHPAAATRHADHLELPGGCGEHAEHCLVSSGSATLPAHPAGPAAHLGVTTGRCITAAARLTSALRLLPTLPLSRAPPAFPA